MKRTEKYFENDAFRKTAAGVILAAEADAKTGGGRIALDGTIPPVIKTILSHYKTKYTTFFACGK